MKSVLCLFLIYTFLALGIFGFTYKAILTVSIGMNVFFIGWMVIHYIQEFREHKKEKRK